jgi:hypothetical protein
MEQQVEKTAREKGRKVAIMAESAEEGGGRVGTQFLRQFHTVHVSDSIVYAKILPELSVQKTTDIF